MLSLLVATTVGFVLVTFFVAVLLAHVLGGLAYILVAGALMKGAHVLFRKYRPLEFDPEYFAIQESGS